LGNAHDLGGTEAQLAAALLLQCAGHERCLGAAAVRLFFDRADSEVRTGERRGERPRACLVDHDDVLLRLPVGGEVLARGDLGAVKRYERCTERRGRSGEQVDIPVAGGDEGDALALALDD